MRRLLAIAMLLVACTKPPPPNPAGPAIELDASRMGDVTPSDAEYDEPEGGSSPCARACTNLRALGCPEGARNASGESCASVCNRALADGFQIRPDCIASGVNVDQVRACGRVRCQR